MQGISLRKIPVLVLVAVSTLVFLTSPIFSRLAWAAGNPSECEALLANREISPDWVSKMVEEGQAKKAEDQRLRDIVQRAGFKNVALNLDIRRNHNNTYTFELPAGQITDQAKSGRCWIFAGLNLVRSQMMMDGQAGPQFEFSADYLHFFNMLEKSNLYLDQAVRALEKRMDPARSKDLTAKKLREDLTPNINDGGYFEWFSYLVSKYGLVPKDAMPETAASQNTGTLLMEINKYLASVSGEFGRLYRKVRKGELDRSEFEPKAEEIRARALKGVWSILATHLGDPPKDFEVRTVLGKPGIENGVKIIPYANVRITPKAFAEKIVKFNPSDYVVVGSFPNMHENTLYTLDDGDMSPGDPKSGVRVLNVDVNRMEELAAMAIIGGQPVWFGADVRQDVDPVTGIMHPKIFDREGVYHLPKTERMRALDRAAQSYLSLLEMDHAMLLTGLDAPVNLKKLVKFKVENSWSNKIGDKGFFHLYHEWFRKYVFEIVVHKKFLSNVEQELLTKPATQAEDLY